MLVPKWRDWALMQLGVSDYFLGVDLFATPWTTTAPLFISKEMDSFSYDWGQLKQSEDHLLWANPPFVLLDKVVAKLSREPCTIVLVTPHWEDRSSWHDLSQMEHKN